MSFEGKNLKEMGKWKIYFSEKIWTPGAGLPRPVAMYTEQKRNATIIFYYILTNLKLIIQSEIIAFSSSALDIRLPRMQETDFHCDEYIRSYSMPTMDMLKVVNHTVRMRKR